MKPEEDRTVAGKGLPKEKIARLFRPREEVLKELNEFRRYGQHELDRLFGRIPDRPTAFQEWFLRKYPDYPTDLFSPQWKRKKRAKKNR